MKLALLDLIAHMVMFIACCAWGIISIARGEWDQAMVAILLLLLIEPKGAQ
jgi:hypothetical protein